MSKKGIIASFTVTFSLLFILLGYNACAPKVNFATDPTVDNFSTQATVDPSVVINNNRKYTNELSVNLTLNSGALMREMFISNDSRCENGVWQNFQENISWNLTKGNTEAFVYVKYRDSSKEGSTLCVKDSIIHDDLSPLVNISAAINNGWVGVTSLNVSFSVTDNLSGVESVLCSVDGGNNSVECSDSKNFIGMQENINYTFEVQAIDKAGNQSYKPPLSWSVDTTSPTLTITGPPAITASASHSFNFNGFDNGSGIAGYKCRFDSATVYTSCETSLVLSGLTDRAYTISVIAVDNVGHESAPVSHSWVQDTTAPTVLITSSPGNPTKSRSAQFSFHSVGENLNIFKCSLDGGNFSSCASPYSASSLSPNQHHTFSVIGIDSAGHQSAPDSRTWLIDTIKPTITNINGPDALTKSTVANFTFAAQDAGPINARSGIKTNSYKCKVDNGSYVSCNSKSYSASGLANGAHKFYVRVFDNAGNMVTSAPYNWTVDNVKPTVSITAKPKNPTGFALANFSFNSSDGSGSGIDFYECKLDGNAYSNCSNPKSYSGLSEGTHVFYVRVTDKAGNKSVLNSSNTYQWGIDLTAPVITIVKQPANPLSLGSNGVINFTIEDNLSYTHSCTLDGVAQSCQAGQDLSILATTIDTFSFTITAVDSVSNSSTKTISWSTEPPEIENCEDVQPGNQIDECLAIIDSFERDEVIDNSGGGFQWATIIDDYAGFYGQLVDADIYSGDVTGGSIIPDSILPPSPGYEDQNRAVFFTGRDGASVHSIYLISKPLNLESFDTFQVGFQYLPVDLELYRWPSSQPEKPERFRVEVCTLSVNECGAGAAPNKDKLNGSAWEVIYESPDNAGTGFNGTNHVLSDWVSEQAEYDLSQLSLANRANFIFRFTVKIDEGFNSSYDHDNNSSTPKIPVPDSGLKDAVILDNVIASASKED